MSVRGRSARRGARRESQRGGGAAGVLLFGVLLVTLLTVAAIPAGAQEPGGGLRGLVPRVRLFCGPCFDEYAQEMWVRSLWWERTDDADGPARGWIRRRGAMFVPSVPESSGEPESAPRLVINGAAFDSTTVYVFYRNQWVNVALALGLPGGRALPTLPPYIQVQQAPIPEEPHGEWGR